jgi:hypothetical protein
MDYYNFTLETSMSKKVKRNGTVYSTGRAAINLYSCLSRDFASYDGIDNSRKLGLLYTNIAEFRNEPDKALGLISPYRFKQHAQLNNFLKKFRFEQDAFTDDELSEKTVTSFIAEQHRLHEPLPLRITGKAVLGRARQIAQSILGDFSEEEVVDNVQFGKKSSIGCPLRDAYIDHKLIDGEALTGTVETTKYFRQQVLPGDHVLKRIMKHHDFDALKEQLEYNHLKLVEVPKTWKSYRLITPLTLLGLFYSYGIGRVVQMRLKEFGLDIQRLQNRHRRLVRLFTDDQDKKHYLKYATADLSAASDSITSELLNRILPRRWYTALKKTFVRKLILSDDRSISSASVLPMGNGATFPVETLVFYCIIRAIGDLLGVKGIYSVYGDDLIYPSRIHEYVVEIFPQLHLRLNLDKTFVKFPFRESCGADFYRGHDVRPYYLKGEASDLTRVRYEAFLYKVYNGLLQRWEPGEIRGTVNWILAELAMITDKILLVPPSYPEESGVRVSDYDQIPLGYDFLPFSKPRQVFCHGSRWYEFEFLLKTAQERPVKATEPYYWLALQGLDDELDLEPWKFVERARGLFGFARQSSLKWQKQQMLIKKFWFKGRLVKKMRTKYTAVVTSRNSDTVSTATTRPLRATDPHPYGSDWI